MCFVADAYKAQWMLFWEEMELLRKYHCTEWEREQKEWKEWRESNNCMQGVQKDQEFVAASEPSDRADMDLSDMDLS